MLVQGGVCGEFEPQQLVNACTLCSKRNITCTIRKGGHPKWSRRNAHRVALHGLQVACMADVAHGCRQECSMHMLALLTLGLL